MVSRIRCATPAPTPSTTCRSAGRLPWDATIALGANNVFDHRGALQYSAPNSSFAYYGGFDVGRFLYMKYTQRF